MKHFPVTVIDNFFNYPDKVRKLALSCEYGMTTDGGWPGVRSAHLHLIDTTFFDKFCRKLLAIFYDTNFHNINFNITAYFQKIESLDNDPSNYKNQGWVHVDNSVFGGLVYLTPKIKFQSGTSVFKPNSTFKKDVVIETAEYKKKFYLHNDDNNYNDAFQKNSSMFDETINVSNLYNRLILVDGNSWHASQNLFMQKEARLTLVFFVEKVESTGFTPLHRMRQIDI